MSSVAVFIALSFIVSIIDLSRRRAAARDADADEAEQRRAGPT